ncbi:MAG: carboxypeptidase-like regulatory domain-containing protein [Candidatus Aenigmatarchaeota archaeon]
MFSNKKIFLILSFLLVFTIVSQFSQGAETCGTGTGCWQACEDYCTYGCAGATSTLNCDSPYCAYDCNPAPKPDYCDTCDSTDTTVDTTTDTTHESDTSFTNNFEVDDYCTSPQTCPVTIRVLDSKDHNPIRNARVSWNGRTLYTNSNGKVGFAINIHSSYNVHVSKSGYSSGSTYIHCQSCGNPISKTVYLNKKESEQCKLKMDNNEITLSKSTICMDQEDSLTLNDYLDISKKPSGCQGSPDSSVRVKIYGRCEYYYDWEQIGSYETNVYGGGSFSSNKFLSSNDFKKISGWKDCKYFRIKTKAEFSNTDVCNGYDCQAISNILKVYPEKCGDCEIKLKYLDVYGNKIKTKVKNTGSQGTNVDLKFFVDSNKVATKHVYLNPGESEEEYKYHSFSGGSHNVKVKAFADCGDSDSLSTTINTGDDEGDLKITVKDCEGYCSDYERIEDARVEIDGPENRSGYTDHYGKIYFNNLESGSYDVEVSKSGYSRENREVYVVEGSLTSKIICLDSCEPSERISIEDVDVDPPEICVNKDRDVEISADVSLESGRDEDITVRFYVREDGDWKYIGKENHYMDSGDSREFDVEYRYDSGDLDEGKHKIKVVAENNDYDVEYAYLDVEECDRCSMDIVDTSFPSKVARGGILNVFVKMKMEKNFPEDTIANVDVYFKPRTDSKDKHFYFDYDGGKDKKTFSFDTEDWDTGWYDIYVSGFEDENRCNIGEKIGEVKIVEGDRCETSIKRFYYPSHMYTDEKATFIPVIENTGSNRARMKTYLYVDGDLRKTWSHYLDPNEDRSMRYLTSLSKGRHDVKLKVIPCGDSSKSVSVRKTVRVDRIDYNGDCDCDYKHYCYCKHDKDYDETVEPRTEVEFGPDELTTGLCRGTVTTIDIKSTRLQEFDISVEGINAKWIDFPEGVKVEGKKKVYIYISPKALGDYEFTLKVRGEERRYEQEIILHSAPVNEVKEGDREWPSVSGALTSLDSNVWGVLLLIVILLFVIHIGRKGMLGTNEEEVYTPTIYSERTPELYAPDRY